MSDIKITWRQPELVIGYSVLGFMEESAVSKLMADAINDKVSGTYRRASDPDAWLKAYGVSVEVGGSVEALVTWLNETVKEDQVLNAEIDYDYFGDDRLLMLTGWVYAPERDAAWCEVITKAKAEELDKLMLERDRAELEAIKARRPELFS